MTPTNHNSALSQAPEVKGSDDLCQECECPATLLLETGEYVDRVYCRQHALEYLQATNDDQPGFDEASAAAALQSMLLEGTAQEI